MNDHNLQLVVHSSSLLHGRKICVQLGDQEIILSVMKAMA